MSNFQAKNGYDHYNNNLTTQPLKELCIYNKSLKIESPTNLLSKKIRAFKKA